MSCRNKQKISFTALLRRLILGFLILVGFQFEAQAKELYLTVRRDFSVSEPPTVEVVYQNTAPIVFRFYRPKNMKEFIASQLDLRRAWKKPRVDINPALYLFHGLNSSRMNFDWIRRTTNKEWREALQKEYGGSTMQRGSSALFGGPEKLISAPDDFTLVTEFVIHPETEDQAKPFDVPGFGSWRGGSLRTKLIEFPKQKSGFYVAQVIQGNLEGQVVLVVNDLLAELQQTDGMALVRLVDRAGIPVVGAEVSLRNIAGKWISTQTTNANGITVFEGLKDTELIGLVNDKQGDKRGTAIIDTEFYSSLAIFPDLYLYTDRPMYKGSDPVRFRGIVREQASGVSRLISRLSGTKRQVKVSVLDLDGSRITEERSVTVSEFGTFSGEFKLPNQKTGVYRLTARVGGAPHSGEFRVKEYVKPLFYVKIESLQETLRAGETLEAKVKVERYAGGVPPGVRLRADLYRVRMETPQWIEDVGMGETGSTTSYFFDPSEAQDVSLPTLIEKLERISLDDKGWTEISVKIPKELPGPPNYDYKFLLKVTAVDADGNFALASHPFLDLRSEVIAQARFNTILADPSFTPKLKIRSVTPSGKPYPQSKGKVVFWYLPYKKMAQKTSEMEIETNAKGLIELSVPKTGPGEVKAEVTMKDRQGNPTSTESSLFIAAARPGEGMIEVSEPRLVTTKTEVKVGEKAKSFVILPEGWGIKGENRGNLYITVAGRKIFEHRVQKISGTTAWIEQPVLSHFGTGMYMLISYPDLVRGWIQRKSSFRIPPKDKNLYVNLSFSKAIAIPGGEQKVEFVVTDVDRRPRFAETSISVVDRAVLDLQPEIRPLVLDFFYPMERLNMMTFLSSEFQSYGYLESVARLFKAGKWFAATKGEHEVMVEEDTAYWNAHVTTNEFGKGYVTFRLPANQTIWKVSAVATDRDGRFGEGKGEFQAQMPVSFLVGFPAFLRQGDRTTFRVTLANQKSNVSIPVTYKLSSESSSLELKGSTDVKSDLAPQKEIAKSIDVAVSPKAEEGETLFISHVQFGEDQANLRHQLRVLPKSTKLPQYLSKRSDNSFLVEVAKLEEIESVELKVTGAISGVLFPTLKWMLAYPYGCVEQLVNTTVPNLVIVDLLQKVGISDEKFSKEDRELRDKASENWKIGLEKLKSYQKAQKGFAWMPGEGEADLSMTLFVLMTLASSEALNREALGEYYNAYEWVRNQRIPEKSPEGIVLTYIESQFAKKNLGWFHPNIQIPKLRLQAHYALESGTVVDRALSLLALKVFLSPHQEQELQKLKEGLMGQLRGLLDQFLKGTSLKQTDWSYGSSWPSYPGKIPSMIALAARALHEHNALDSNMIEGLKKRVMDLFNGDHFGSTYETAHTLIHLSWLIEKELREIRSVESQVNIKVVVDGKDVVPQKVIQEKLGGWKKTLSPHLFSPGSHKVRVEGLPNLYHANLRLIRKLPFEHAKSIVKGWELSKEYFKVDESTQKLMPLHSETDTLKVGDLVYVQIGFQGFQKRMPWWASRYYILSDELPSGFYVIEEDKEYKALIKKSQNTNLYRVRETGISQIRWYFDFSKVWMDRQEEIGYFMRAAYAGKFQSGVAKMEDFYDETAYSQTAARSFSILPKP